MPRVYWRQFACYSFMLTLLGVHVLFQYAVVPNAVGLAGSDWAPAETVSGPDLALACEQWIGRRSLKVPKGFVGPEVDEAEDGGGGGGGYAAVLERRAPPEAGPSSTTTPAPAPHPWAAAGAGAASLQGENAESWRLRTPEVVATQQRRLHFPRHLTNDEPEVGGGPLLGDNAGGHVSHATSGATLRPPPRPQTATPSGGVGSRDSEGWREGAAYRPYVVQQQNTVPAGDRLNTKYPGIDDAQGVYAQEMAPLRGGGISGGFIVPAPSQPSTTHPWAQRFHDNHIKAQNGAGLVHKEQNLDDSAKMHMDQPAQPQGAQGNGYNNIPGSQGALQGRRGVLNDADGDLHQAQSALHAAQGVPGVAKGEPYGAQGAPNRAQASPNEAHHKPYSEQLRTQGSFQGAQGSIQGAQGLLHEAQNSLHGAQSSFNGAQGSIQGAQGEPLGAQGALHRAQAAVHMAPGGIQVNQHGAYLHGGQGHGQGVLSQHQGVQPVNPIAADQQGVLDDGHHVLLTSNQGSLAAAPGLVSGGQGGVYNGQGMSQGGQGSVSGGSNSAQPQGLPGNTRLLYQALPGDQGIVPGGHHGVLPGKHGVVYDNNQGLPGHHGNNQKLVVSGDQGVAVPSVHSVLHGGYRTRDDSTNPHHQRYTFNCANIQMITIKRKLGQGVTKQVYLGVYDNRKVAVKMVTRNVIDVLSCMKKLRRETADLSMLPGEKHKCYTLPNMKLMKEILLLNQLDHPNLLKLQGYCVRSEETDSTSLQEHGIVAVYEYGLRFYISNLREWPWQLRVRTATELADLLEYLQHSPLGSLRVSDFKDAHFLLKDGRIKLTDLDDVTSMEPDCQPNLGPEVDLKGNRTPAKVCGYNLKCVAGICPGYNAMKNLDNFNRLFFSNLLTGDTPETEEHMSRLRSRLDNLSIDASELRRILFHFMDVPFLPGYS